VREIGIDYAQGFLLHRPEPIENLLGGGRILAQPAAIQAADEAA
jgi:EAL domain-containing protein (putative c-di-GMP-specific phosphodiesterase class I)